MATTIARLYNWVDDKNAGTPITASRQDGELDQIITALNQKVIIKSSAPASPIAGMLWLDSTNKLLKQYRNSEWVVMGCVHVGTAAPTTGQEGDIWYDTTNDKLYVYRTSGLQIQVITSDVFGTLGQLLISQGNGTAPIPLGQGTANQVLASQGVQSAPIFKAVSDILGTGYVSTTLLKTTTGEVSTSAGGYVLLTLPGGTYGFQMQTKTSGAETWNISAGIIQNTNTSYDTYVTMWQQSGGGTGYAQQRYITASGLDWWLFLLIDKTTKDIVSAYSAPDHPSYGRIDKAEHPFRNYDSAKYDIAVVDKTTITQLKEKADTDNFTEAKLLLSLVNTKYKVGDGVAYESLHSGEFVDDKPVMVDKLPDYIKCVSLIEMTTQEKQDRDDRAEKNKQDFIKEKQKKQNILKQALGITDKELEDLKELLK